MKNSIKKISAVFLSIVAMAFFMPAVHLQTVHAAAPGDTASGGACKLLTAGQRAAYEQVIIELGMEKMQANDTGSMTMGVRVSDSSGRVPVGNVEVELSTTVGKLMSSHMILEDGVGTNVFRSESLNKTTRAVISAEVVEADDSDLIGLKGYAAVILYVGDSIDASAYQVVVEPDRTELKADDYGYAYTAVTVRVTDSSGHAPAGHVKMYLYTNSGYVAATISVGDGVATGKVSFSNVLQTRHDIIFAEVLEADDTSLLRLFGSAAVTLYAGNGADVPDSTDNTETENTDVSKKPVAQKITLNPDKVENGQAECGVSFSLHAQSSGNGKLSYKSSNSKILSVSASGKVTAKGIGSASITVTASKTAGYKAASRTLKLTVVPKKVKIQKGNWKNGQAVFEWSSVPQAGGYQYSFAYNPQFSGEARGSLVNRTSLTVSEVHSEKSGLYIRIRAYKKVGGKTYYGKWSDSWFLEL